MDKMVELESIAEQMSKVMFRYAMQLNCPGDYMEALKRWEDYEKSLINGS